MSWRREVCGWALVTALMVWLLWAVGRLCYRSGQRAAVGGDHAVTITWK